MASRTATTNSTAGIAKAKFTLLELLSQELRGTLYGNLRSVAAFQGTSRSVRNKDGQ
jgi:hypothetical protein